MIRFLDFILSLVFLILLLPVFFLISLSIAITDGFPIFFVQKRVGKDGILFPFFKFRSMKTSKNINSSNEIDYSLLSLEQLKIKRKEFKTTIVNDPRITGIGKFLRKTSLDEIPQLVNIFLGQMSFVGPRPDTPVQRADYDEVTWNLRCRVKPGLTGLAQISGRSDAGMKSRTENDLLWVKEKSITKYIQILIKTPLVLLKGTN